MSAVDATHAITYTTHAAIYDAIDAVTRDAIRPIRAAIDVGTYVATWAAIRDAMKDLS